MTHFKHIFVGHSFLYFTFFSNFLKKKQKKITKKKQKKGKNEPCLSAMTGDTQVVIGTFSIQDTPALTTTSDWDGMDECLTFSSGKGHCFI